MFSLEQFVANERTPMDQNGVGFARIHMTDEKIADNGAHFDPWLRRPYRDERGRVWVDVTKGYEPRKDRDGAIVRNHRGQIVYNRIKEPELVSDRRRHDLPVINITDNATVLRKDQWIMVDQAVLRASRKRLRLWADMRAANTFGGFDGMATPILEYEKLNDAGEAIVDMEGLTEGNNFQPSFTLQGMPLPITHCDFTLSQRFLASSRRGGGFGADTIRMEMAARRVGEAIEQTAIGTQTGVVHGTSTDYAQTSQVYGLTNHPERITKTSITAPTGSNGTTILTEWLDHRDELFQQNFHGPFNVYTATSYDQFLDDEFKTNSDKSLRNRLLEIDGITSIKRLDYLTTSGTNLWTQLGEEIQAVSGMEIMTMQWETKGGLQLNFKVMGIQVPRIRSVLVNTNTTGPAAAATAKAPVLHCTT